MKIIFSIISIFSFSAFAGFVVPNIDQGRITPNESGSAAALSVRNSVSLALAKNSEKVSGEKASTSNAFAGIGYYSQDKIVAEVVAAEFSSKSDGRRGYSDILQSNLGYRVDEKLSAGVRIQHVKASSIEINDVLLSATYHFEDDLYFGGGVEKQVNNLNKLQRLTLKGGVGVLTEKLSTEVVFSKSDGEKNSTSYTADIFELNGKVTYLMDKFQLQGELTQEEQEAKYTSNGVNETEKETTIEVLVEYSVRKDLIIGFGIEQIDNKAKDKLDSDNNTKTNSQDLSLIARSFYKEIQLDFSITSASAKTKYSDGSSSDKSTSTNTSVGATYFF